MQKEITYINLKSPGLSLRGKISLLTSPVTYWPKAFFYILTNKANWKMKIIAAVLRQEYRIHWLRDA